eukprot:CAMPEP_0205998072 /NCGR_PEP_ID=MMETSP1464-20131121/35_1 /ASSEMBLY_ACC=CAM_ASM_001124 /TAXON_ID=119497 /ORGANISM="Exanthemachrysis gayraliae, Strain RCC1523" /LENGTH=209 /DNA_ID=CAMNT_0053371209 /DNA_START=36 /DNA_END=666 /DNA_ORIENTATION=+
MALLRTLAVPALGLFRRALSTGIKREVISTAKAPAAIGPYSQAVKVNNLLFVSGQIPIDPKTGEFASNEIEGQTKMVFENMKAIVEAGGGTMKDVVKCTVLLADMGDFAKVNEIYASYFTEPYPARAAFAVKTLPKGALVEMSVSQRCHDAVEEGSMSAVSLRSAAGVRIRRGFEALTATGTVSSDRALNMILSYWVSVVAPYVCVAAL